MVVKILLLALVVLVVPLRATYIERLNQNIAHNGSTMTIKVEEDDSWTDPDTMRMRYSYSATQMDSPRPNPGHAPHGYIYQRTTGGAQGSGTLELHIESQDYPLGLTVGTFYIPRTGKSVVIEKYWGPGAGFEILASWSPDDPPPTPATKYQLKYSVTNTRDYAIKYVVFDSEDDVIHSVTVNPGETKTGTVLLTEAQMPYTEKIFVPATFSDGGWTEVDLDDGDGVPPGHPTSHTSYPEDEDPPGGSAANVDVPYPSMPSNGTSTTAGSTPAAAGVWTATTGTVDTERLDKGTYKQGVDKIVKGQDKLLDVLKGTGSATSPVSVSDPDEPEAQTLPVAGATNLLPVTPTFFTGTLGSSHTVSANLTIPAILGTSPVPIAWSLNLETYSAPIAIVRGVLAAAMSFGFFVLCVNTARGAFADK